MTVQEYHEHLARLNLTPCSKATAATLGISVRQLWRISHEQSKVPEPIAILLRLLVERAPSHPAQQ